MSRKKPDALPDGLPAWDEMSQLDRGVALLHMWDVAAEGRANAVRDNPACYFDDPALTALAPEQASRHATEVTGGRSGVWDGFDSPENDHCYHLALAARNRPLPTWEQMSDLDRGAALLHVWKVEDEGREYAVTNYPARYLDAPVLVALARKAASRHAAEVTGGYEAVWERLGYEEYDRLYDLALVAERSDTPGSP